MIKTTDFLKKDNSVLEFFFYECAVIPKKKAVGDFIDNFDRIRRSNLGLVLSDNIRIGVSVTIKNFKHYFINPRAFTFGYITRSDLVSLNIMGIEKTLERQRQLYLNETKKISGNDILFKQIRTLESNNSSVLLLGPLGRNKAIIRALEEKYRVTRMEDPIDLNKLNGVSFQYIISSGYAHKIPQDIVDLYRSRLINLHASYLPWGKGIGTILFSFLLGQPLGVSFHLIDKEIDTGDILHRVRMEPDVEDTSRTLHKKLLGLIDIEFLKYWPLLDSSIWKGVAQKEFASTVTVPYFSRLEFEKMILNLPRGYDTNVFDLHALGKIHNNNEQFFKVILEDTTYAGN